MREVPVSLLASKLVLVLPFSARREYVSTVMSTRVRSSTPTQTILNWMLPSPHRATPHHPVTVTVLTVHMLNFEFERRRILIGIEGSFALPY